MTTEEQVRKALSEVYDPEIRMDIISLGLVYKIQVDDQGKVTIDMTFTTPMCPYGPRLVEDVKQAVEVLEGVTDVEVTIVFDPPWEPNDEVKAVLGI